jgi:hypothetical protein
MILNVKLSPEAAKMVYQSLDASPIETPVLKRQAAEIQEAIAAASAEAQAEEQAHDEALAEDEQRSRAA